MGLTIFTFIVMGVIVGSAMVVFVVLGRWPGQIARERNHPNADAVNVAGWLGVITMGILWPLAFVWAYMGSARVQVSAGSEEQLRELAARVEALEAAAAGKGGDA